MFSDFYDWEKLKVKYFILFSRTFTFSKILWKKKACFVSHISQMAEHNLMQSLTLFETHNPRLDPQQIEMNVNIRIMWFKSI